MSDAKPNSRNKEMWAPLHIAARKGMLEAIRWAKMINDILHELDLECFDFNAPGGPQKWTMLHLAGYSGHYKVVEEILSAGTLKYPINLFARNGEMKTARNCSKGNMALAKILRKAENKYIKDIFESQQITEMQLLANHV
jgi:ankyrin repeat protein